MFLGAHSDGIIAQYHLAVFNSTCRAGEEKTKDWQANELATSLLVGIVPLFELPQDRFVTNVLVSSQHQNDTHNGLNPGVNILRG